MAKKADPKKFVGLCVDNKDNCVVLCSNVPYETLKDNMDTYRWWYFNPSELNGHTTVNEFLKNYPFELTGRSFPHRGVYSESYLDGMHIYSTDFQYDEIYEVEPKDE